MIKSLLLFLLLNICAMSAFGQTATMPTGSGTAGDPYQITTLENLYWITQNQSSWSSYFVQTADIDASSSTSWDGGSGFTPIGNGSTNYFTGSYNGKGYSISGIFINRQTTDYVGLFGLCSGTGTIEDLSVKNVNITGKSYVGGLIGLNNTNRTVTKVYSTGSVTGKSTSTGGLIGSNGGSISNSYSTCSVSGVSAIVGGLVGFNSSTGSISKSFSTGAASGSSAQVGGLAGSNSGSISNSYSKSSASGSYWVGGLVGLNNYSGVISNTFAKGSVPGSDPDIGGLVGGNSSGTVSSSFWDTQTTGQASSKGGTGKTTAEMKTQSTYSGSGWDFIGETTNGADDIWGFNAVDNSGYPFFAWEQYPIAEQPSGSGTVGDPYLITSLNNLFWITQNKPSWSKYYTQMNDIDASQTSKWDGGSGFSPIGQVNTTSFSGTYKGKGHTISGLTINRLSMNYVGLFGVIFNGKVDSLGIIDLNIQGQSGVGGIAGNSYKGTISNCYTTGTIYSLYDWAGGRRALGDSTVLWGHIAARLVPSRRKFDAVAMAIILLPQRRVGSRTCTRLPSR